MSARLDHTHTDSILGVSEAVARLRSALEKSFPFIWIQGEVTDLSLAPSGHIYFSLKDEAAQIKCVWFASRQGQAGQRFDPLTGEVYENPRAAPKKFMRNGLELLCAGRITYYAPAGICQLAVDFAQPLGSGMLAQIYEETKARLAAEGIFSKERRPPCSPQKIALITSPHGAAIHDFLELARARGSGARIRLFPVSVQGEGAADKIARSIRAVNGQGWADVIVLIRGGGSLEDLWAFNEEILVRAVYASRVPVLTGIGHEIDTSLADLAADVRAATPSHAAQLLWPARSELWQRLDTAMFRLGAAARSLTRRLDWQLAQNEAFLAAHAPGRLLSGHSARLAGLAALLRNQMSRILDSRTGVFETRERIFKSLAPWTRLPAREQKLGWHTKLLRRSFSQQIRQKSACLAVLEESFLYCGKRIILNRSGLLARLEASLRLLNPENPLLRGYALVFQNSALLRSVADCGLSQKLVIRLADGVIEAQALSSRAIISPEERKEQ